METVTIAASVQCVFLVVVLLTVPGEVSAGEEECLGMTGEVPIMCYNCTANRDDHYCGDPFNKSYPDIPKIRCKAYCVKWRRTALSGRTYYQRTCSDQLQISMRKTVVCIEESRPSSGHLCFCDKTDCNSANQIPVSGHVVSIMVAITLLYSLCAT